MQRHGWFKWSATYLAVEGRVVHDGDHGLHHADDEQIVRVGEEPAWQRDLHELATVWEEPDSNLNEIADKQLAAAIEG